MQSEEERVQTAERMRRMLSYQRHDWLNHVQVLLGYIGLQKIDHMKAYLHDMAQKAGHERWIMDLLYAPLAVALFTLPYRYARWGVQIDKDSLCKLTLDEERSTYHLVECFFPWLEAKTEGLVTDMHLAMTISKKEKLIVTIQIAETRNDDLISSIMRDLHEIQDTIAEWGGEIRVIPILQEIRV